MRDVFISPLTKTTSTGVVSVAGREERLRRRVPHHFAHSLNVREVAIHPVVVEVSQRRDVIRLPPDTTGMNAISEENTRDGVGGKLMRRSFPDWTGEKVNQCPEGDPMTFELTTSVPDGPRRNTRVFGDVMGHAEVTCSERPPLQRETRLLKSNSGSLDDAADSSLGNAVGLRATGDGSMVLPSEFAGRRSEFRSSIGIEAPNSGVSSEGEEGLLRVFGRVA